MLGSKYKVDLTFKQKITFYIQVLTFKRILWVSTFISVMLHLLKRFFYEPPHSQLQVTWENEYSFLLYKSI